MRVGDINYIDTMLEYYGVASPKKITDMPDNEWALKYCILEDLRKRENAK